MRTRRHALGQNFLHHQPTIKKIAELVETKIRETKPKCIIEIGPGKLALTRDLITISHKLDLPLHLVERDRYLEEDIRTGLAKNENNEAQIHFMDAATDAFSSLITDLAKKYDGPVFIASNLPYSASSQILARACDAVESIAGLVIMVQKELAQRMTAGSKTSDRGAFTLLIESHFKVKNAFDVGPGAFNPPPKVMSTVLELSPAPHPFVAKLDQPRKFEQFCKLLFSNRRKMIRKILNIDFSQESAELQAMPKKLSGTERPEELDLDQVIALFKLKR